MKSITTSVGQVTNFTYDYAGNLITQADSGPLNLTKSLLLDDLTSVAYESASDGSTYSVLSGRSLDSHLGIVQSTGQIQYGLSDAINSTVATIDQNGTLKSQFFYEPYGSTATASSYPFQFTGRTPVSGGLFYFRARFYSAATGRFISEDPIGFGGADSNLYRYVWNSAINLVDPVGLQGWLSQQAIQGLDYANQFQLSGHPIYASIEFGLSALTLGVLIVDPLAGELDILTDRCLLTGGKLLELGATIALSPLGELRAAYLPYSGYGLDRSLMGTLAFSTFRVSSVAGWLNLIVGGINIVVGASTKP